MTELVKRSEREVTLAEAERISRSKLVPKDIHQDPASVEYMMHIAGALGIDPASAFQHVYVFKNKKDGTLRAGLSAHLMAALAVAAGHKLHVEGTPLQATATLIRKTSQEDLHYFQAMAEEERQHKTHLLSRMQELYTFQRQQIRDQIEDLTELAKVGGEAPDEEIAALRKQLSEVRGQYDFDRLRKALVETRFDLARITRFECTWTMKRANSIDGLTNKDSWVNFGPEMLKSRCKSGVVRDGAPEVLLGIRNFMANLGVAFSGERDDELAMANALYTPEELGIRVDGNGIPLEGEVVDVTDERTNRRHAALMDSARTVVEKYNDSVQLLNWSRTQADREGIPAEDRKTLLSAVRVVADDAGRGEETIPFEGREDTLSNHLNSLIDDIQ